jgi:hypothetical protein
MTDNNQQLALAQQGQQVSALLSQFEAVQIQTADEHAWACQQLLSVKAQSKELEKQMRTATKPMNDALTTVRGWFKQVTGPLDAIEACLKRKIGAYELGKQKEQQQAVQQASVAFSQGQGAQGLELLNKSTAATVEKQQGVSVRRVVKYRIVDPNLVPREYCVPSPQLIQARVGVDGLTTQIPGVEVFEDSVVAGRVG